jgi:hypothetical protein
MVETVRINTNKYAVDHVSKSYCGRQHGQRGEGKFKPVTSSNINQLFALIIYMGIGWIP